MVSPQTLQPWKLVQFSPALQDPRAKPKQYCLPLVVSKVFLLFPPRRIAAGARPAVVDDAVQSAGICPAPPHRKQLPLAMCFADGGAPSLLGAGRLRDGVDGAGAAALMTVA